VNEPFVPIEDLAKHFTVSVSTVRAWVRQGLIPKETYIKMGNTYRFSISKVVDSLTRSANDTPTQTEAPDEVVNFANTINPDEDL
jgi:hypothetical protein